MKATIILALILSAPASAAFQNQTQNGFGIPTSLRIVARGPNGERLELKSAEMFLTVWNGGALVQIPRDGGAAVLKMDQAWLCEASKEICTSTAFVDSRMVLKVDGYAPVTAKVDWPEHAGLGGGASVPGADVEFSNGLRTHLEAGNLKQIEVSFRRPVKRSIKVVDDKGNAAAGIRIASSIFYTGDNHCAVIMGEPLAEGKTGTDGTFQYPDVDGEVAFQFVAAHYELQPPGLPDVYQWIFTPSAAVTTIQIHKFEKHPLNLQINGPAINLRGLKLQVNQRDCGCGNCGFELAPIESRGRFFVEDFYPEEYDLISIINDAGITIWQSDPNPMSGSPVRTITLPDDAVGIYALIDKVEFQPGAGSPQRVRIDGVFSIAQGDSRSSAIAGYLYLEINSGIPAAYVDAARRDWAALNSVAGTGIAVGFGLRGFDNPNRIGPPPRIRAASSPPPAFADGYSAGPGVLHLDPQIYGDIIRQLREAAGLK